MSAIAWKISDGRLVVPGSADELLTDYYNQTRDWDKAYVQAVQWLNDLSATVKTQWDLEDYQRWTQDLDAAYANRILAPTVPGGPSWLSRGWAALTGTVGKWLNPGGTAPARTTSKGPDYRWAFAAAVALVALWALKRPSAADGKTGKRGRK